MCLLFNYNYSAPLCGSVAMQSCGSIKPGSQLQPDPYKMIWMLITMYCIAEIEFLSFLVLQHALTWTFGHAASI